MAYHLNPRLFVEHGPALEAAAAAARRSPAGETSRNWLALTREKRLSIIDNALKAA
jgi:hypothetical protein